MNEDKIRFLQWLINRMQFKYSCLPNDTIIYELNSIIELLKKPKLISIEISNPELDLIISKYYADFQLDKCDDMNFGFTEEERDKLRLDIKNMVYDIVNKNIPKDSIIKG